jgi:hypothetical protein
MSVDTTDDLHAAEDRIGVVQETLKLSADQVHRQLCPVRYTFELCPMQWCVRARESLEPFVRPSCEEGEHDEDCGGYHPEGMEP